MIKKALLFLFLSTFGWSATGEILLPVNGAKLSGAHITTPAAIDAGLGGWRLLFDTTTEEEAVYEFLMPDNYSSGLTFKCSWTVDGSITSGNVEIEVEVMAVASTENPDTETFDTTNSTGAVAIPGTSGQAKFTTLTLTNADSVAAGEHVVIRVSRDVTVASDATEDLEMRSMKLTYTTT